MRAAHPALAAMQHFRNAMAYGRVHGSDDNWVDDGVGLRAQLLLAPDRNGVGRFFVTHTDKSHLAVGQFVLTASPHGRLDRGRVTPKTLDPPYDTDGICERHPYHKIADAVTSGLA